MKTNCFLLCRNFFLCFLACTQLRSYAIADSSELQCKEIITPAHLQLMHRGWPHLLSCSVFLDTENYTVYDIDNEITEAQCIILNSASSVIFNESTSISRIKTGKYSAGYLTPGIIPSSSRNYTIKLVSTENDFCILTSVKINVTSLPNISCTEFVESHNPIVIETRIDRHYRLTCLIEHGQYPKIHVPDVQYQWNHNCSDILQTSKSTDKSIYRISNYSQSGLYVCSAVYNGMTRYILARSLCLYKSNKLDKPFLICEKREIYSSKGEKTAITCNGNFGSGRLNSNTFGVKWAKIQQNGNSIFRECTEGTSNTSNRIQCFFENLFDLCYETQPRQNEIEQELSTIKIHLILNNVVEDDFGTYMFTIVRHDEHIDNATVTLNPNLNPELLSKAATAGIFIGLFVVFLILTAFVIYFNVYIRVYFKRYFGGYLIDNKPYAASFAYSMDTDVFAKEELSLFVPAVRDLLEDMGFSVYDSAKDGWIEFERGQNIQTALKKSHRVIIFLSSSFINDEWSLLTLLKGFDEMIHSGSKLIFILLPGMKEYIKQHSKHNDTCRLIQRAIKLNYSLELENYLKLKNKRSRFILEDAMPKLSSQRSARVFSVSTNCETLSFQVKESISSHSSESENISTVRFKS